MKKIFMILLILAFIPVVSNANGIGLVGGYPGGVVFRLDMGETSGLDFYFNYYWTSDFGIAADYVFKKYTMLGEFPIQIFYGAGVSLQFYTWEEWVYDGTYYWSGHYETTTHIYPGIRGKFGVSYFFEDTPWEIFIETGPALFFGEYIDTFNFAGGAGFRYRF